MIRKAFKLAQTERPGAVYLAVPEDVEEAPAPAGLAPAAGERAAAGRALPRPDRRGPWRCSGRPGTRSCWPGTGRPGPAPARRCAGSPRRSDVPVATTFHGKGVFPDDHPLALGAVGFMRQDYVNFGFDQADADHRGRLRAAGVRPGQDQPGRRHPDHPHPPLPGRGGRALRRRRSDCTPTSAAPWTRWPPRPDRRFEAGRRTGSARCWPPSWPAAGPTTGSRWRRPGSSPTPARRCGRDDIVLVDTGALKMWMARLYPTYEPNTCLISNGLSTMAWTVPGAIGAKIARPDARVLVATGDGAFLMNSQEIETALRLRIPFVILIWVDDAYGLISWKMDLEIGRERGHHVQQPRLRRLRRELRRDRVPDQRGQRAAADAAARRWPRTRCRSSPARSTTRPTWSSSSPWASWSGR